MLGKRFHLSWLNIVAAHRLKKQTQKSSIAHKKAIFRSSTKPISIYRRGKHGSVNTNFSIAIGLSRSINGFIRVNDDKEQKRFSILLSSSVESFEKFKTSFWYCHRGSADSFTLISIGNLWFFSSWKWQQQKIGSLKMGFYTAENTKWKQFVKIQLKLLEINKL